MRRHRFLPLLVSSASLGIALASGRGAVVPSSAENAFRAEAQMPFQPEQEETRTLQQSLFKKPAVRLIEPQLRILPAVPMRVPATPPASRPAAPRTPSIAPPPPPREVSLAERELSLQPAADTPYDRYSGSVRAVISHVEKRPLNMPRARALMGEAHDFRYHSADPYRAALPETTAATHTGDCKAKALWLYDQLGDPSALYVIGKTFKGTKSNHAWLYWRCDARWWILDPTNRSTPIPADSVPEDRYVPYYSFGKEGAYRHRVTWIGIANVPAATTVAAPVPKARVAKR